MLPVRKEKANVNVSGEGFSARQSEKGNLKWRLLAKGVGVGGEEGSFGSGRQPQCCQGQ